MPLRENLKLPAGVKPRPKLERRSPPGGGYVHGAVSPTVELQVQTLPVDTEETREMLTHWGVYIRTMPSYGPSSRSATQALYHTPAPASLSDVLTPEIQATGEHIERLVVALPTSDRMLLGEKFIQCRAIENMASYFKISRRSLEQSLNVAIGRVSALAAFFPPK